MTKEWFKPNGIMAWVTITGSVLIGVSILVGTVLEREIVERTGANNRRMAFLHISEFMGELIGRTGEFSNHTQLREVIEAVREIRHGIRRLSVYEITPESSSLILSTNRQAVPEALESRERTEIQAGRSVMRLDKSSAERAWQITVPIRIEDKVVGALRGLYSIKEYDDLIEQEVELVKPIGTGVVVATLLAFVFLIRAKVHRPIHRLLGTIRSVESGNLSCKAPVSGTAEIQEIAAQLNRMIDRVREAVREKDRLLAEVRRFNETLQQRVTDATKELQQADLELVEARLAVERSQRLAALGELSAAIAHELGNPLNVLSGHLQLLTSAESSVHRRRHLVIIQSEITRMVGIIKQLLNQTDVHLQSAPVNLNRTVCEVLALFSLVLPKQHITVHTDLKDDLPPVACDPHALHGLLFNLIANAVQAMLGGGDLTIRTRITRDEGLPGTAVVGQDILVNGVAVRLTIGDSGKGIDPKRVPKIFEPFFTTRYHQGGTGLGLAICHRVVTNCGGKLAVKSEVGVGSEFTIDLPTWKVK